MQIFGTTTLTHEETEVELWVTHCVYDGREHMVTLGVGEVGSGERWEGAASDGFAIGARPIEALIEEAITRLNLALFHEEDRERFTQLLREGGADYIAGWNQKLAGKAEWQTYADLLQNPHQH
jgi:hypothetical protein